ncbi:isocitrate/isopropylmalate dehydrogenase family protein [Clostridium niameyense]|uniref:Isocitrate/isopropylmalate dehydrogenase family protein n=1 Tax=Clostridium niameyense TaxID=1622073 RepID=A0A6M0RCX6_9CLOT|nr:isocitrate/isopropylmalate dehydrogenase family protein [Clostridium niameyense]NEZ47449.1 isocitrate/isopropylmalate dehydrogenase family protein [Clostridium niameyense]
MAYNITLIPGDGIGPEVTYAAKKVLDALNIDINWDIKEAGASVIDEYNTPLPDKVLDSIKKNKVALKGPVTTPVGRGFRSVNVMLRKSLNLYANIRPIKTYKGVTSRYKDINLIIVRENTEDLYAGIEHMITDDIAESVKIISRKASDRIVEHAFNLARKDKRNKITAVHKANIMKMSDGLFLKCAKKVASKYKDIEFEDVIVDAMAMKLVLNPEQYDILVMPNLYGDILSDMAAGLVGGLGLISGANIGEEVAVFEAAHGAAPDIAGKNKANPTACILSAAMMLKYIGEDEKGIKIEKAIEKVLEEGKCLTEDLGGNSSTEEFTEEVINKLSI